MYIVLFLEQPRLHNAERQHDFLDIHKFLCLNLRFYLFNLEINGLTLLQSVVHTFLNY